MKRDLCPARISHPGDIVSGMNAAVFTNNWALIVAAVPALIALVFIFRNLVSRTARGQLIAVLKDHRETRKALRASRKVSKKTAARAEKLASRSGNIAPRMLQEARDAAEDAKSLERIAHDRVLVTANHVRQVIVEEFPPIAHEKLRNKYLRKENGAS